MLADALSVPQTNRNPSSVSIISITINVQLSIQISIQNFIQLPNIKSNKNLPKLLANIFSTHLFVLYNSLLCCIIECFPTFSTFHIVFFTSSSLMRSPINLKPSPCESPRQPGFNSIGFPSTLPK